MDIRLPPLTQSLHTIHHLFVCSMWTKWDPYLKTSDLLLRDTFNYKESTIAPGSSALRQSPLAYSPSALGLNSLHISMPLAFMAYRWKSITVALHKNKTWWGVSVVASTRSDCGGGEGWLPQTAKVYSEQIHGKWQTPRAIIWESCASFTYVHARCFIQWLTLNTIHISSLN